MMSETTAFSHGQFCWVDFASLDLKTAAAFYTGVMGWTCEEVVSGGGETPPYSEFRHEGKAIAGLGQLSDEMQAEGTPPAWNSYIHVDDINEVTEKAAELGGTIIVQPTQVMDFGWLSFAVDPGGATIAFWQKNQRAGADLWGAPLAVRWNELTTKDLDGAMEFYGNLLGWQFRDNLSAPAAYKIAQVNGEDAAGLMQMTEEWGDVPPRWTVYFDIETVDAAAARTQQLGGTLMCPVFETPVGRLAILKDPQGAAFNLIAYKGLPES